MSIIIGDKKLTSEKIIQVARFNEKVKLHPEAINRINKCRQMLEAKIQSKEVIYGLNTGIGEFSEIILDDDKLQDFQKALYRLCLNLAKQIIVDGEGAKKFITINVIGARSTSMAKNVGFSIANSPLFKTAIAGEDPNWGRIVMAIGKSGENVIAKKIQIKIGNYLVCDQNKTAKDYNEKDVKEYMKWDSINIEVNLNIGSSFFTVYTCDFTHDYIDINADYRN